MSTSNTDSLPPLVQLVRDIGYVNAPAAIESAPAEAAVSDLDIDGLAGYFAQATVAGLILHHPELAASWARQFQTEIGAEHAKTLADKVVAHITEYTS